MQQENLAEDSYKQFGEDLSILAQKARELLDSDEFCFRVRSINQDAYRKELIEVAASAIAALQDNGVSLDEIINAVKRERDRQDVKFGRMPRSLDPRVWIAVLIEEADEANREISC